jgi:Right handed beta helix region
MIRIVSSVFAATLLTLSLGAGAAQAQTRVFVAAQGSDSNPCTFAAPCRTFQHAHDMVAAGGEIDVLDPAGYGSMTITKSLSIQGHGWASMSPPASGNAITISAGPTDTVFLRGLILEGFGTGNIGLLLNSSGILDFSDCVVRNFTIAGIGLAPSISNRSVIANSYISNTGSIAGTGIDVIPTSASSTTLSVNNTVVASFGDGISAETTAVPSAFVKITVSNSTIANNSTGLTSGGSGSVILVTRSILTGNGHALNVTPNGAAIESFGDNTLANNGAAGLGGTFTSTLAEQ